MNKKEPLLIFSILFFISYDSAPLSASLLSDWNEVHRMTPADLESLQQELQLGSPMILSDTIPSDAWLFPSWNIFRRSLDLFLAWKSWVKTCEINLNASFYFLLLFFFKKGSTSKTIFFTIMTCSTFFIIKKTVSKPISASVIKTTLKQKKKYLK